MDRYQRRMQFKRGAPVYPDGKNRNAARTARTGTPPASPS